VSYTTAEGYPAKQMRSVIAASGMSFGPISREVVQEGSPNAIASHAGPRRTDY